MNRTFISTAILLSALSLLASFKASALAVKIVKKEKPDLFLEVTERRKKYYSKLPDKHITQARVVTQHRLDRNQACFFNHQSILTLSENNEEKTINQWLTTKKPITTDENRSTIKSSPMYHWCFYSRKGYTITKTKKISKDEYKEHLKHLKKTTQK